MTDTSRWYVAATISKYEQVAEEHLARQSFKVLLPWIIEASGRRELRFPGYILIAFDAESDRWRSINGTRGIRGLLFGEKPSPLPRGVAESIPLIEAFGLIAESGRPFVPGDQVIIRRGPFEGHTGKIAKTGAERVQILISLLSRQVPLYVSPRQIEHAA